MFKRNKRRKEKERFQGVHSGLSFKWAMTHTKEMVGWAESLYDKVEVIDYVMKTVRKDVEIDALTRYLYKSPFLYKNENYHLFPLRVFNNDGEEIFLIDDGEKVAVKLAESCIISYISKLESVFSSVVHLKKPFEKRSNNHYARYYKEVDVCFVWQNLHSVSMGMVREEGEIIANEVSLVKVYPHLNTDGSNWINSHTGDVLMEVHDFRIAILYELARMKYKLNNNQ